MNLRIAAVRKALYDKVQSISESNHTILLTPELLQRALSGGWQAISARLGKSSVIMNISQQPMSIKIKGSPADYQLALSLLRVNTTMEMTRKKSKETCVICWEEAVDPFSSPCYHTYCTECFVNQCNAAVDNDDFSIHCRGDEAKCLHIFTIPSLQNLVPSAVFEELLENSFKSYVQTHSRDFQYCPTPDCSQIYRITQSTTNSITSASFDCPNCLTSICISCASTCHDGITCADNKDIRAGYVQALNTFKAENDIRDCPTCKTPIEKVDGCNHLRCMGCKTHICWFCMCSLESAAACYAHMEEKHGGNGLWWLRFGKWRFLDGWEILSLDRYVMFGEYVKDVRSYSGRAVLFSVVCFLRIIKLSNSIFANHVLFLAFVDSFWFIWITSTPKPQISIANLPSQ